MYLHRMTLRERQYVYYCLGRGLYTIQTALMHWYKSKVKPSKKQLHSN